MKLWDELLEEMLDLVDEIIDSDSCYSATEEDEPVEHYQRRSDTIDLCLLIKKVHR